MGPTHPKFSVTEGPPFQFRTVQRPYRDPDWIGSKNHSDSGMNDGDSVWYLDETNEGQ